MEIREIFTAVAVGHLTEAERWYTQVLGRRPDHRPMSSLVQWKLGNQAGLQVSSDPDLAGRGTISLAVDDVKAERRRPMGLGIDVAEPFEGTYSTIAIATDPDGNRVILATPPSPPYPAA